MTMEKPLVHSVVILTLINIVDALANSAVNPSLIFYVTEVGGNLKDYGLIFSISYCSAMLMMIVYGMWVDSNGNKYKLPYAASFTMGILGSLLYFVAKMLPSGAWAVNMILIGRFITGCGVAGRSLAFSYVATAIPRDQQRTTLTLLAMTRSCGYLMGPLVNLLVAKIDTSISIFSCNVPLNPRNSVGLALALTESCLMVLTLLFLQDPPPKSNKRGTITAKDKAAKVMVVPRDIWNAVTHFDILFPILIKFVFSCNNSFYQVAVPPVASDLFGWSPLQISYLISVQSGAIFVGMCGAMYASIYDVANFTMIALGNASVMIGGIATVLWWEKGRATIAQFTLSNVIVSLAIPLVGPSVRSKFTREVSNRPELENSIGLVQALFEIAYMIAGFVSPNFIAHFVLKDPMDIKSSGDSHELTPYGWYVSISALLVLIGLLYEEFIMGKNELGLIKAADTEDDEDELRGGDEETAEEETAGETSSDSEEEAIVDETSRLLAGNKSHRLRGAC